MHKLILPILFSAVIANANTETEQSTLRTELDQDVAVLVGEIQERMAVLERIQLKIAEMDSRIERLESRETTNRTQIQELRQSRIQLAELHGAMKTNAEQALVIVETYSKQLAKLLDQTDS